MKAQWSFTSPKQFWSNISTHRTQTTKCLRRFAFFSNCLQFWRCWRCKKGKTALREPVCTNHMNDKWQVTLVSRIQIYRIKAQHIQEQYLRLLAGFASCLTLEHNITQHESTVILHRSKTVEATYQHTEHKRPSAWGVSLFSAIACSFGDAGDARKGKQLWGNLSAQTIWMTNHKLR